VLPVYRARVITSSSLQWKQGAPRPSLAEMGRQSTADETSPVRGYAITYGKKKADQIVTPAETAHGFPALPGARWPNCVRCSASPDNVLASGWR